MKSNMGSIDRALRIIVGLVLVGLALTSTVGWWGWLGIIPIVTGVLGNCPLYSVIGVNTCGTKQCNKK
ncbi:YgaP family membrane protein [Denitrificimonas caeni]|uniref:DUF2892 domain-containing protein n=1 Tax=Denitrificimonas caeni TaxID=521720 RepID=A0AAE9VQA0_9GAMM|nr:DUF2892 domain-containing protein [Denitrificimonas caeni]WBE25819.1 DUF2892 domain-containing protein [Denitrificimonas caeni]